MQPQKRRATILVKKNYTYSKLPEIMCTSFFRPQENVPRQVIGRPCLEIEGRSTENLQKHYDPLLKQPDQLSLRHTQHGKCNPTISYMCQQNELLKRAQDSSVSVAQEHAIKPTENCARNHSNAAQFLYRHEPSIIKQAKKSSYHR